MKRRRFVAALGGMAAMGPCVARTQGTTKRIGVLMSGTASSYQSFAAAFEAGLASLGWHAGDRVRIEYRWGNDSRDTVAAEAADLVRSAPNAIVASTTVSLAALQRETRTIPIVFTMVSDPVAQGFAASLARPGGNVTGFVSFEFSVGGKWVGILRELEPRLARVLVLNNPKTSPQAPLFQRSIEAAAKTLGIAVVSAPVYDAPAIPQAIDDFAREPAGGLIVPTDNFVYAHHELMFDAVIRHRMPAIYADRSMTELGGLMSYSIDNEDNWRRAAMYVDRILKGANPADLPIQLPLKYWFVVNQKTANALGFTIPMTLLARADQVIE